MTRLGPDPAAQNRAKLMLALLPKDLQAERHLHELAAATLSHDEYCAWVAGRGNYSRYRGGLSAKDLRA